MKKVKSTCMLFLTAIIWGFAFVAQQFGAEGGLGTYTFNAVRFTFGCISLVPVVLIFEREHINRKMWKKLILCSLLGGALLFIASSLQQYGVELGVDAGKAGFLTGTYTVLVPIIGFLFFKYKNSALTWIGAFLAVAGLFLLNLDSKFNFNIGWGEVILFIGAIFWALHIIFLDSFVNDIPPLKFALGQFIVTAMLSYIFAFIFEKNPVNITAIGDNIISLLYCGVMSVGVAYTCQIISQRDADPTFAAIVFSTESVFSMIGQIIILHIFPNMFGYIGCVIIFTAVVVSQLDYKKVLNFFNRNKNTNLNNK